MRRMRYYLLNWEETGESGAEDSKLDGETGLSGSSKKRIGRSYRSEPFFLEENQHTLFSDVIEKPFLLVSKMFWDVSKMYEVPVRGKEMVLLDGGTALQKFIICQCIPNIIVFQKKPFLIMIIL